MAVINNFYAKEDLEYYTQVQGGSPLALHPVNTQISLDIGPVCSESLLYDKWVAINFIGIAKTGRMHQKNETVVPGFRYSVCRENLS